MQAAVNASSFVLRTWEIISIPFFLVTRGPAPMCLARVGQVSDMLSGGAPVDPHSGCAQVAVQGPEASWCRSEDIRFTPICPTHAMPMPRAVYSVCKLQLGSAAKLSKSAGVGVSKSAGA